MRLATPESYVDEYGVLETGRLLSNKGTISPAGDNRSDYVAEMYVDDNEDNDLEDKVIADLNRFIDNAQAEIVPRIRRFLVWPLQSGGFDIPISSVPSELSRITREVARYYLHDEDTRTVEEVSFIERRYRNALMLADKIGAGTYRLTGVDSNFEETILYTI